MGKRVAAVTALLIFVAAIVLGRERFAFLLVGANEQKVLLDELRVEYSKIPVFSGAKSTDGQNSFDKEVVVSVSDHLFAPASLSSIFDYYKSTLPTLGWKYSKSRVVSGRESAIKFCKNRISLTLDVVEETGLGTTYYVGAVWARSKRSPFYCPGSSE